MDTAPPPWELTGECVVALIGASGRRAALPSGLHRLPGPVLVSAVRWDQSPVGPYSELAVGEPARLGTRVGVWVSTMVVDTAEARLAGRAHWGFPKELGSLKWTPEGTRRELRWEERDIAVGGDPYGPAVPAIVPIRCLQRRDDGLVVAPGTARGRARLARVRVSVPDDDDLAQLAGDHRGFVVSGLRFSLGPATQPSRIITTVAAPQDAAEPALTWGRPAAHAGD